MEWEYGVCFSCIRYNIFLHGSSLIQFIYCDNSHIVSQNAVSRDFWRTRGTSKFIYTLGQHSFEIWSVSGFHRECCGADLISISHSPKSLGNFSEYKCWKIEKKWEMWNEYNFRVISMRGQGISFSWPWKLRMRQVDTDLRPSRTPTIFTMIFPKNRCENRCRYIKLLKKSLQLWKKVV